MRCLANKMKEFYQDKSKELKQIKQLWNTIYQEKTEGFYVNAPKMKKKKGKDAVVTYMIRYAGRPAMAESRILSYDKKKITYYYEDHKTEKRIEVKENIITFMKKLVNIYQNHNLR